MTAEAPVFERKVVVPGKSEWTRVKVPEVDARLTDGTSVYAPIHQILVAHRYPTDVDGNLLASLKQREVAALLHDCNSASKLSGDDALRYPTLFQDDAMRQQLGEGHKAFDENFERNNQPWRWGYVADSTRHNKALKIVEGISGQLLVNRVLCWKLPGGEVEVGPVLIAPGGMVPEFRRHDFEKQYGAEALKRLEEFGVKIPAKDIKFRPVTDLGYAVFTLPHDARGAGGELFQHSHHQYAPSQEAGESAGVRDAHWDHPDGRGCFYVYLGVDAEHSNPRGSFPLVRGGVVAKIGKDVQL